VNSVISPLDGCSVTECQPTGDFHTDSLAVDGHQQRVNDVGTNGIDSRCEPVPSTSQNLPRSTASDKASDFQGDQQEDSDMISGDDTTDRVMSSSEVRCQQLYGHQLSDEVPCQQHDASCDVTCHQHPSNGNTAPSDQSGVECRDWEFFAARRVDVPLLLDVLLARKHRDRMARDFLLNLPASVSKKYEVFSRQNPLFVCLDIIK